MEAGGVIGLSNMFVVLIGESCVKIPDGWNFLLRGIVSLNTFHLQILCLDIIWLSEGDDVLLAEDVKHVEKGTSLTSSTFPVPWMRHIVKTARAW